MLKRLSELLDTDYQIYLACSGAGSGIQDHLWQVPGVSKVLVGAEFPYAMEASDRFLGFKPPRYCDRDTAVAFAMEAYYRGWSPGKKALGFGMTATVTSTAIHRGDHRVHFAIVGEDYSRGWSVVLKKPTSASAEARKNDGLLCDTLGAAAILEAAELGSVEEAVKAAGSRVLSFMSGGLEKIAHENIQARPLFAATGKRLEAPANGNGLTLFPGAFNPPHEGHFWMAKEHKATFHITTAPPHKPALSVAEILQRAKLLDGYDRLFTLDDPLYLDKARRFPGAKVLVGVDALERMLDPKWGVPIAPMIEEFKHLGIRFLVADRELDGKIVSLDDIKNAPRDICQRILRPAQHLAMSSTKVRAALAVS